MSLYKCNVLVRGRHSETYSLFDAVIQDLPDGRRHLRAPFAVRREYAVKPSETDTRLRQQRRQPQQKIRRARRRCEQSATATQSARESPLDRHAQSRAASALATSPTLRTTKVGSIPNG